MDWNTAAEVAAALAARKFEAGTNVYAPVWYRKIGPALGLGDCGAIDAIRSGDPIKLQAALAALRRLA